MAYLLAYNFQRPLKALKYMTPYGKMTGIYEQNPDLFCFDPAQKAAGLNSYIKVEAAQAPGGEFEGVTAFASKSPEQAARIAGALTLWADLRAPEVTGDTMAGAITLAQHYLGEVKRLAEAAEISAETDMAEKLRCWLWIAGPR